MISSISGDQNIGMSLQHPQPTITEQTLTKNQQLLITETLSEFSAENLSHEDALSIVETFSKAGIQPSSTLESKMFDLGFNAKSIGILANVTEKGNRPPPPPKQTTEEITSMVEYLAKLLEEKLAANNSNELSTDDKQSILAQVFEKFDIEEADSIIDTTV